MSNDGTILKAYQCGKFNVMPHHSIAGVVVVTQGMASDESGYDFSVPASLIASPAYASFEQTIQDLAALFASGTTVSVSNLPETQSVFLQNNSLTITGKTVTAEFETDVDLHMAYSNLNTLYGEAFGGAGASTFDITKSACDLAVSANNDYAIRQTRSRWKYRSGKVKVALFTFSRFEAQAGVSKRVGLFNGGQVAPFNTFDGVYMESSDAGYSFNAANNGAIVSVSQAQWYDRLDGTGPSGIVMDWSKGQLIEINFLWLGYAGAVAYVYNNGEKYKFAELWFANSATKPFMLSPNQPMRYELRSNGGAGTFTQGCATVGNFGGGARISKQIGIDSALGLTLASTASWYLLYAFRLRSTRLDASCKIADFTLLPTNNNNVVYCVVWNPTFSALPTYQQLIYLDVEVATGNGVITATDRNFIMQSDITEQKTSKTVLEAINSLKFGSDVNGTPDVIAILAKPRSANAIIDCIANIISDR